MVDRDQILELVPHYVAIVVLVFVALSVIQTAVGDLSFWMEFAVVIVLVAVYRPVVQYLDLAPSAWERQ